MNVTIIVRYEPDIRTKVDKIIAQHQGVEAAATSLLPLV